MNLVDIFVLTTILITTFIGFKNGILNMIIPIITVIIGLSFSSRVSGPLGSLVAKVIDLGDFQQYLVFALFFIILLIVGTWIARFLKSVIVLIPFGGLLNRLTGGIAGLLVGLLICTGLISGIEHFGFKTNAELSKPIIQGTSAAMQTTKILPASWQQINKIQSNIQ